MASNDAKIKLTLDGEAEFKNALKSIKSETKLLNAEMKATTSAFDKNTSAQEKNEKAGSILERQTAKYQERISLLRERIQAASERFGENSDYVVQLKTDLYNTTTAMNKAQQGFRDIGSAATDSARSGADFNSVMMGIFAGGALLAGIKAVVGAVKEIGSAVYETVSQATAFADDMLTLSAVTGLSTETLQEFKYMEDLIDVSLDTVTGSLTKLTRNMESARSGTGATAEAFKTLGVSVTDSDGSLRDSYDVFLDVIDALGRVGNETERDALAMQIFGKSGQQLNPLILQGSEGLRAFAQEAHEVGYVMSEETLGSLGAVQDSFDRLSKVSDVIHNQLGVMLIPVVQEITEYLNQLATEVDWERVGEVVGVVVSRIVMMLKDLIGIISSLIVFIKTIVDAVIYINDSLPALWDGVVQTVANMAENIKEKFKEIIDNAKNWGKDMIQGFIDGIKAKVDALKGMVSNVANIIRSFLHFSRPDEGPLRQYEQWMPDFMKGLAAGISQNTWRVEDRISELASSMSIDVNGSGTMAMASGPVVGQIVINGVADEAQIDRMVNTIERKLGQRIYR